MTALDITIGEAARRGDLAALTLWRLADGRYQANVTRDKIGWRVAVAVDPVAAINAALGDRNEPSGTTNDEDIFA